MLLGHRDLQHVLRRHRDDGVNPLADGEEWTGYCAAKADTTARPPDDALWWFADTRGCKSVWAVAWNYKNKIQQVMYYHLNSWLFFLY